VEIVNRFSVMDTSVFCMYDNICKITQTFQLQTYQKDTVWLHLDVSSQFGFLNPVYFQKIKVEEKGKKEKIPFSFELNTIKFAIPSENSVIELSYFYQPDYFYMGNEYMPCVFCPYQQSWFSWYFSASNMEIKSVNFKIPDHVYFFANLPQKRQDHEIELLCDSIPDGGIAFFWMNKLYYEKKAATILENQYNLYLFQGATLVGEEDVDSCYAGLLPAKRSSENLANSYLSSLEKDVRNIEKIFPQKVNVDIVDACLDLSQDENTIRWGSAFLVSENQMLIIMDTSFWNGHFYTHEMIHAYNDLLPSKNDSAYYFFHESMTEFLAIYCKYDQQKIRDSVYEAKILKYIHSKQDYSTIFEIDKNTTTLEYGGTYGIIYLKTPFIINYFAKKIGEEKFIEILTLFYEQARNTGIVNFQELENAFKSNGISNENWSWFVKNL
jgi:hypothetical protein